MKHLSIIIPSYNTEEFIDKNMATFLDERLFNDAEILLINDGSKDGTAKKAVFYEAKYSGYVRFIDKENGGHGSVINRGIKEATGKYFKVIDADDWVDTENLVSLVEKLKNTDVDLVLNPYIKIHQQTNETRLCSEFSLDIIGKDMNFEDFLNIGCGLALHSITIKTSILRDNCIRVTEKCFYEDFQYTLYPIPYIKSTLLLDFPVYYYLVGQKSQSVNAASGLKNMEMYIKVFSDAVGYLNGISGKLKPSIKAYMEKRMSTYLRSMYNIFLRNGSSKEIRKKMKEADNQVQSLSEYFYNMVAKDNCYIKVLRSENVLGIKIISLAFKVYKNKEVS